MESLQLALTICAWIGFAIFSLFAFIGMRFTGVAWKFAAELAIADYKARKLRQMSPELAKQEIDKLLKEIDKEDAKKG
jgi:hypothetical protein